MNTRSTAFPLPLLALALAAFAIGTTEFVIVGLLPAVAADTGVTLPSAGLLVTGYALGVALGAPPLAALTARATPYRALSALMVLFIVGNLMCALAPDYGWLMAGRIVASLTHGAFFGLGATVAAALVEPQRRSAAIALMFSGLTLANVLGVPAGAWIGQYAGWRATFWCVSGLGVVALAALLVLVPRSLQLHGSRGGAGWRIVLRPRLLGALGLTALGFGGIFTTLTFLSPLLQTEAGFSAAQVNALLLLFGLGLTVGNMLGGWAADRWPGRSMFAVLGTLAALQVALHFVLALPVLVTAGIFLWGMAAFATAPGLQSRVLDEAADAPALGSTLNIAAFNLGNAVAAWIGARAIDAGMPMSGLPLLSAALTGAALVLLFGLSVRTASPNARPA
ncbi:MFS transporter [Schlegelella sp. S2-27]|uniref:MFS transporter n=1 Tax=Caldimonas mangrovi TaxID=2944811 RepID=A0ABT0YWH8_9BURK|nr:MFS transporter [Caldimonas mangrovi]MCM5682188.1 MFS transporter [Caldimonas mangrovi]